MPGERLSPRIVSVLIWQKISEENSKQLGNITFVMNFSRILKLHLWVVTYGSKLPCSRHYEKGIIAINTNIALKLFRVFIVLIL